MNRNCGELETGEGQKRRNGRVGGLELSHLMIGERVGTERGAAVRTSMMASSSSPEAEEDEAVEGGRREGRERASVKTSSFPAV